MDHNHDDGVPNVAPPLPNPKIPGVLLSALFPNGELVLVDAPVVKGLLDGSVGFAPKMLLDVSAGFAPNSDPVPPPLPNENGDAAGATVPSVDLVPNVAPVPNPPNAGLLAAAPNAEPVLAPPNNDGLGSPSFAELFPVSPLPEPNADDGLLPASLSAVFSAAPNTPFVPNVDDEGVPHVVLAAPLSFWAPNALEVVVAPKATAPLAVAPNRDFASPLSLFVVLPDPNMLFDGGAVLAFLSAPSASDPAGVEPKEDIGAEEAPKTDFPPAVPPKTLFPGVVPNDGAGVEPVDDGVFPKAKENAG